MRGLPRASGGPGGVAHAAHAIITNMNQTRAITRHIRSWIVTSTPRLIVVDVDTIVVDDSHAQAFSGRDRLEPSGERATRRARIGLELDHHRAVAVDLDDTPGAVVPLVSEVLSVAREAAVIGE